MSTLDASQNIAERGPVDLLTSRGYKKIKNPFPDPSINYTWQNGIFFVGFYEIGLGRPPITFIKVGTRECQIKTWLDGEQLTLAERTLSRASELPIAHCEKCSSMQNVKRELGRIKRQLGNLQEQIENTILSLE